MKHMKKIFVGCGMMLALAAASVTAFAAAAYETPAAAAAGLTGKTPEQVTAERQAGKSYGAIAAEAGKLEEFQQAVQEIHKGALEGCVANGTLTQEQADAALAATAQRQAVCDGTGAGNGAACGRGAGGGVGRGQAGTGRGQGGGGRGQGGAGRGQGGGGAGLRNGSCLYQA